MTSRFLFSLCAIAALSLASSALAQTGHADAASAPPPPPPPPPPMLAAPMPTIQTSNINNEALAKRIHSPLFIVSTKNAKSKDADAGQGTNDLVINTPNYHY